MLLKTGILSNLLQQQGFCVIVAAEAISMMKKALVFVFLIFLLMICVGCWKRPILIINQPPRLVSPTAEEILKDKAEAFLNQCKANKERFGCQVVDPSIKYTCFLVYRPREDTRLALVIVSENGPAILPDTEAFEITFQWTWHGWVVKEVRKRPKMPSPIKILPDAPSRASGFSYQN